MKIILVTSDLTYAPENYDDVFEFVARNSSQHVAGVALIKISKLTVLAKLPYFYFAGCRNIAYTLAHNFGSVLLGRKRRFLRKLGIPFIYVEGINDRKAVVRHVRHEELCSLSICHRSVRARNQR